MNSQPTDAQYLSIGEQRICAWSILEREAKK